MQPAERLCEGKLEVMELEFTQEPVHVEEASERIPRNTSNRISRHGTIELPLAGTQNIKPVAFPEPSNAA